MASLNKSLYEAWMAQNALNTIEQNFAANFYALSQLNAGKTMNTQSGRQDVMFEALPFWNGVGLRGMYFQAYMLIDPMYESNNSPIWANMVNQVEDIPANAFANVFKTVP